MKLSELARVYDRVAAARNDTERVRLLAAALKRADKRTLAALAHFTLGELVPPQYSDRLGIGPGDTVVIPPGTPHKLWNSEAHGRRERRGRRPRQK